MKKTLIIAVVILLSNVVNAQKKEFNFSYTVAGSNCPGEKAIYFSPLVSCIIEDDTRDADIQEGHLENKWEKKVFANYTLKTYCYDTEAWVWDSYGAADEKRDETIAEYKALGYKVYSNFIFGFHFTRED